MTALFDFQALAARARADNPDAELFELIDEDKAHHRRWRQMWAQIRSVRGAERSSAIHRLAEEGCLTHERLAAARPATLEGLLAKLRHAMGKERPASAYALQHAALMDAIAWLDPPKPKRARGRGVRRMSNP